MNVLAVFLGLIVIWADDILLIERHLVAKFRTFLAFYGGSSLLWMKDILGW